MIMPSLPASIATAAALLLLLPPVLGAPAAAGPAVVAALATRQQPGGSGQYYFTNWHSGGIQYQCQNGQGGSYTVTWSGRGDFVCGKGWAVGGPRSVHYSGAFDPKGPSLVALYGWAHNPLVEYYVVEAWSGPTPQPGAAKGSFTADGGVYTVYENTQHNQPSIDGTTTFRQYWSVRNAPRAGGTITTGRHFGEWQRLGLPLGQFAYMVIAVEAFAFNGQQTSGSASITVS